MNECQRPGVCGTGSCMNRVGTYECLCPTGMLFDSANFVCIGSTSVFMM